MKKIFALLLVFVMVLCVCGCNGDTTTSSEAVEIEYQRITVDENGNEITTSVTTTSSENDTQSTQTPVTSSTPEASSAISINPIVIDYNTTVEVDICDDVIRGYLDATTAERQYSWLNEYSGTKLDYQAVDLDWYFDGSSLYTITVSENADFSNSYTIQTKFTTINNSYFVPGKTYYWKVTGNITDEVLGGGKIHIKDAPVRWIKVDGTGNVRDMGGWKTESGKTVKYEMMYRGQKLDNVTQDGFNTLKTLNLKTELDLRYKSQGEEYKNSGSICYNAFNYVFLETSAQYDRIFSKEEEVKANYKKIFEVLSNKNNYPIYTHCSAGADRTGTFAFITNGLLGVSYEDLTRDFELTSFSSSGKRWRGQGNGGTFINGDDVMQEDSNNYVAWGKLYKKMMEYGQQNGCTTLSQSIEYWLTSYVGVPKSQIDAFKSIMLE